MDRLLFALTLLSALGAGLIGGVLDFRHDRAWPLAAVRRYFRLLYRYNCRDDRWQCM